MARNRRSNKSRSPSPQDRNPRGGRGGRGRGGRGLIASAGRRAVSIIQRATGTTPQNTTVNEQSIVPSPAASTTVVFTPDRSDTGADVSQTSFLSEVAGRTPRFGAQSRTPDRTEADAPEASDANTSFLSEVADRTPRFTPTIAGPIPAQATTTTASTSGPAINTDLIGVMTPSSPRTTQSQETHLLQQSMRQNAQEQIRVAQIMTTMARDNLDSNADEDGEERQVRFNLEDRLEDAATQDEDARNMGPGSIYQDLRIETVNEDEAESVPILVGALGNSSGTPLDGTTNLSFGDHEVDDLQIEGDESGDDPNDPDVIGRLLTKPVPTSYRSVTTVAVPSPASSVSSGSFSFGSSKSVSHLDPVPAQSSEQPDNSDTVQHSAVDVGGTSSGTQSTAITSGGNPGGTTHTSGNAGTSDSNAGPSDVHQTELGRIVPFFTEPDRDHMALVAFSFHIAGGTMASWGMAGRIRAQHLVRIGRRTSRGFVVDSLQVVFRAALIDIIASSAHSHYSHQRRLRIRQVLEGLDTFMLRGPTLPADRGNSFTMLENCPESTAEVCEIVAKFITHAMTAPDVQYPILIPVELVGVHVRRHANGIVGSFEYLQCFARDGTTMIVPYGNDANGRPITDPPPIPRVTIPAVPANPTSATGAAGLDPTAMMHSMILAVQAMAQAGIQADERNAQMAQQQMDLQASVLRANAKQLHDLGGCMSNIGSEVGRAIASNPIHSNVTLNQGGVAGQSTDPNVLGSLTRRHPIGLSVPTFDYGPYVQAYQPQPNDKNTRRIDEATHQIIQRELPPSVKRRYEAAHSTGTIIFAQEFIQGYKYVVETSPNRGIWVERRFWWHSTLGTGCVTGSGHILQPNIQEREFARYAPMLDTLDPANVFQYYRDLCRVGHENGVYIPAYEDYCPERSLDDIECGDTKTACVPTFCRGSVPRWSSIIHNHLKRDKAIPTSHPQYSEIRYNPNGYAALALLITPYHPAFTENRILIQPHPVQGRRSLDDHFRRCDFHYYHQQAYLHTMHNWDDDIHLIRFLDSCQYAAILRTLYQQEKHVPGCKYKFTRGRIVTTLKEYMASPSFLLLGGKPEPTATSTVPTVPSATAPRTSRGRFAKSDGGTARSGNTGRSPRDRNVRYVEAISEPSLLDGDFCQPVTEDHLVAKLIGNCIMGCGVNHDAYKCPALKGDEEAQKKVFSSVGQSRRTFAVRELTTVGNDVVRDETSDDDRDLIDLNDDLGDDSDQDFP